MSRPALPARTLAKVDARAYRQVRLVVGALSWLEWVALVALVALSYRWAGVAGAALSVVLASLVQGLSFVRGRFYGEHKCDDGYYSNALGPHHEHAESRRPRARREDFFGGADVHFMWDLCDASMPPPEVRAALVVAENALRGGPGAMEMEHAEIIAAELDRLRVSLMIAQQEKGVRR